jgi:oligopeptidase A
MSDFPFLTDSLDIPWPELTPDRIVANMREAIRRAQAELDALIALPAETLTYANTFDAYAKLIRLAGQPWGLVSHLESVQNTPEFRAAFQVAQPEVTRFFSGLPLNSELWAQLKLFGESPAVAALSETQQRHVSEVMADFREAGADLSAEDKARVLAIDEELAKLTSQFSDNHLDSLNSWEMLIEDPADLAGLPESAVAAARASAQEKSLGTDEKPVWRFTLQAPSYMAVVRYADNRKLREKIVNGFYSLASEAPNANEPLVWKIVGLRHEKAQILGKDNFADVVLARRMAGSGKAALRFEEGLYERVKTRFDEECTELAEFKKSAGGGEDPLEPWDLAYWGEKMRKAQCDFDEESLRPYFSVDKVIAGLFALTEDLFGVRVVERTGKKKPPVWHEEVQVYDLFDVDSGRAMGTFYTDWFPRDTKRSGAWMVPMRTGDGGVTLPSLAGMAGNMTKPLDGKPALLLHDEVETVFHEFGHLLHQLLTEVPVPAMGGTDVAWDFVELPSQILENWCWERVSLDRFARHHETDAPIPEALFQNLLKTRTFRSAGLVMRQLSFGRTDLLLHLQAPELIAAGVDLESWWREVNAGYLTPTASTPRSNLHIFGHLFGDPVGYAAGYYSYMWADVLASDAFSRFKAEGVMNAETGRAFRATVLSKGNSAPPQELFRDFMGRDPDPEALLRARGLA